MDEISEQDRVVLARAGDRAAFSALVDLYWLRLYRWLVGLTGNRHLAEDLTQTAFLKAWTGLPGLQANGNFRVWLYRIAQNLVVDHSRSPGGREIDSLKIDVPSADRSTLNAMIEAEDAMRVRRALEKAPVDYRAAYLLRVQEDMDYVEIAEILKISEVKARWRVYKARRFLLDEFRQTFEIE